MRLKCVFLTLIFLPFTFQLFSDDVMVEAAQSVNWEEAIITIDITASTQMPWTAPSSRYDMDKLISKRAPVLIAESLSELALTSQDTIGSAILDNTQLYGGLLKLPESVGKTFSTASEDRKSLTVRYDIPIFPNVAELFIDRQSADPLAIDLRHTATAEFTGILIYAAEELPLKGTNRLAMVRPSVFPKLYDENLNIILDMSKVEPQYLREWGTAGFSSDSKREFYGDRVGAFPLRTMAMAVFGKNETDLVLSERAVRQILSSEHNRQLISSGRVMIIFSSTN